jgi:hypothetical protein
MKNALKKFKDLFFEEEEYEEIVDDGIEEEPVVAVEPVFQDIRLDKEEKEEEPVVEEVVEEKVEPKKSELLTIAPSKDKPKPSQSKTTVKKPEVTNLNVSKKTDYEFTQVISPIYGLKSTQDQTQPVVKKMNPKKVSALKSPIGTVLSPMYGVYEENPMVHEVEVEPELVDMKVDDFLDKKETKKPETKTVNVVNLSLFDDEQ